MYGPLRSYSLNFPHISYQIEGGREGGREGGESRGGEMSIPPIRVGVRGEGQVITVCV